MSTPTQTIIRQLIMVLCIGLLGACEVLGVEPADTPPDTVVPSTTTGEPTGKTVTTNGYDHTTVTDSPPRGNTRSTMSSPGHPDAGTTTTVGTAYASEIGPLPPSYDALFVAVAAGSEHSCGLRVEGTISCWGANGAGQSNAPSGRFTDVAAGTAHSCGLLTDGEVICWGADRYAQTTAPVGPFVKVVAGGNWSCGLRPDLSLSCWGGHSGWITRSTIHATLVATGPFVDVSVSAGQVCVLDDYLWVDCGNWKGGSGARGAPLLETLTAISAGYDHACALIADGRMMCWGSDVGGETHSPGGAFTAMSAGGGWIDSDEPWDVGHSCGIRPDGTVLCWGSRSVTDVPEGTFVSLSSGTDHVCGLRTDGTVRCWGRNWSGQSIGPGTFVAVSAGAGVCGVRSDGLAKCWAANGWTEPPMTEQLVDVAAGGGQFGVAHTCGISEAGVITCSGANGYGQSDPPRGTFRAVDAGTHHNCAIRDDRTISC